MANSSLQLSSLDFDTLKQNFKNFLISQSVFKDYDFEGSNINVLLDVMSYNSYLNSFYLNMVASEMFLDSAQKLDSVISHAKELNYLPRSNRSSKAVVSFNLNTTGITSPIIIPKGTTFTGTNSNGVFTFITDNEHSYLSADSTFSISNLEIYEGSYLQDSFIVDNSIENQKFIMSNQNIDTDSLEVIVTENNVNTSYSFVSTLYNLKSSSTVYFLQATSDKKYEIIFGDNVFGKTPKNGSIITTSYRTTNGSDSNGVTLFNLDSDLGPINGGSATAADITVVSSALSGANSESIESIRFNAPRHYQSQGRCITDSDYESAVLQKYPEVQYVSVYGGDITNTSVNFGTVYISPSTYSGTILTDNRKTDIESYINKISPIGIRIKVIDPDYMYINLSSTIHVNFANTTSSTPTIISKATNAVKSYNLNNLQNFNTAFRLSKLDQTINDSDIGIMSTETTATIFKIFSPPLNTSYTITCNFFNPIKKGSLISSEFITGEKLYVLTDHIEGFDLGSGKIYKLEKQIGKAAINFELIGSINYASGVLDINSISYFNIFGGLKIFAETQNKDVYCKGNTILEIDTISGLKFTIVNQ